MDFDFRKVNENEIGQTEAEWQRQLENMDFDLPTSRFLQNIDSARQAVSGNLVRAGNGDVVWYGVFGDEQSLVAKALVEIAYARPRKANTWLKMLTMRVEPNLDEGNSIIDEDIRLEQLQNVMLTAFSGALYLGGGDHEDADTVKIWCDDSAQVQFFEAVSLRIKEEASISIQKQGTRWVVLKLNKE